MPNSSGVKSLVDSNNLHLDAIKRHLAAHYPFTDQIPREAVSSPSKKSGQTREASETFAGNFSFQIVLAVDLIAYPDSSPHTSMELYYILYISSATSWFSDTELNDILAISRKNNDRASITGLLLYADSKFIQLLEGDKSTVQQSFEHISTDPRHNDVTIIAEGNLKDRNFPEWTMGFKAMDGLRNTGLDGLINPGNRSALENASKHIATKLLKAFMRTARMGV